MNINEIIKNRRATPPRFLKQEEISKETILQLVENANWAPNHKNTEPWRFKIYTGKAKQKLAGDIYQLLTEKAKVEESIVLNKVEKLKTNLERVPVVIVIIMERDQAHRIPEWEESAAVAMAVQNMWLSATEMGLGAFWATPQFMPFLENLLQLKTGQKALGFFYLGKIAMEYPSPGRGPVESKVEWF
ncbi:MAG TPA: nitroreductase [Prolixibacteraceae bacterium]|nr:nitroreductase [Prolixibacteraceae bacterium]